MIIKHIKRTDNEIRYWYYNSETAKRMNMKSFLYVQSWLPDLITNVVSIQQLIENKHDFTNREFLMELLMLITEYQQAIEDGWMSSRVFETRVKNMNYHLAKNNINIKFFISE